jgi:hypothetical protein
VVSWFNYLRDYVGNHAVTTGNVLGVLHSCLLLFKLSSIAAFQPQRALAYESKETSSHTWITELE